MTTKSKQSITRPAAAGKTSDGTDAIALLTEDHDSVKAMFKAFEKLKERDDADDEKAELVARICRELTIHATIEEEIFYPAVRERRSATTT